MRKYGTFHSLTDFIATTIPKRGAAGRLFVHAVMDGLKRLDAVQERNPSVTLSASAGGGIWVTHDGQRQFMVIPGQTALRVLTGKPGGELAKAFRKAAKRGEVVDTTLHKDNHQWRVPEDGLELIWDWVEKMPAAPARQFDDKGHPRYFPGPARQAALEMFERSGAVCPGAMGRKKHRVDLKAGDRVEFDHILPYARGGASSEWNLQVLCKDCNRAKRATGT